MADASRPDQARFVVEPMRVEDIRQVRRIEKESFPSPWPRASYRREVLNNERARYLVVRRLDGPPRPAQLTRGRRRFPLTLLPFRSGGDEPSDIVGYAGLWLMIDEAHITTVAVDRAFRGRGLGELMLIELVKLGWRVGVDRITLEVRMSNSVAQNLYRKYGFYESGVRPRYYSDDLEDALTMSREHVDESAFRRRLACHEAALTKRLRWESRL